MAHLVNVTQLLFQDLRAGDLFVLHYAAISFGVFHPNTFRG